MYQHISSSPESSTDPPLSDHHWLTYKDPRSPHLGHRVISFSNVFTQVKNSSLYAISTYILFLQCSPENIWDQLRWKHGILEGHDLQNTLEFQKWLPVHLNYDWIQHTLSTDKGLAIPSYSICCKYYYFRCFVGQETLSKTLSTPVVRQRLVILQLSSYVSPQHTSLSLMATINPQTNVPIGSIIAHSGDKALAVISLRKIQTLFKSSKQSFTIIDSMKTLHVRLKI